MQTYLLRCIAGGFMKFMRLLVLTFSLILIIQGNVSTDAHGSKTLAMANVYGHDLCIPGQKPLVLNNWANSRKFHSSRNTISSAADILSLHEGFSAVPYKCSAGKWTIGYGKQIKVGKIKIISKPLARKWLEDDLIKISEQFDEDIPWWKDLCPARKEVLLNLAYNVGIDRFYEFDTFLHAVKTRQFTYAANQLTKSKHGKSLYKRQVGSRADDLATAMRTGIWDMDPMYKKYAML